MTSPFKQLIKAAKAQSQPQRLLFVLAKTDTSQSQTLTDQSERGTISPVMCVDKLPQDLTSLKNFINEADAINKAWDFILIAGMNGENGKAPSTDEAEPLLNKMANDLVQGQDLSRYLILDRNDNQINILS